MNTKEVAKLIVQALDAPRQHRENGCESREEVIVRILEENSDAPNPNDSLPPLGLAARAI